MADRNQTNVPEDLPEEMERRLQALAREGSGVVPADVAERLAAMRRQAVAELDTPVSGWSSLVGWPAWAPVAVTATVLVMMIGAWVYLNPTADPMILPLVADSEVAIVEDLELLEELEFLAWLEEESEGAG